MQPEFTDNTIKWQFFADQDTFNIDPKRITIDTIDMDFEVLKAKPASEMYEFFETQNSPFNRKSSK